MTIYVALAVLVLLLPSSAASEDYMAAADPLIDKLDSCLEQQADTLWTTNESPETIATVALANCLVPRLELRRFWYEDALREGYDEGDYGAWEYADGFMRGFEAAGREAVIVRVVKRRQGRP